ncbi:hypothetical protein B0T11DRAFT_81045 [Plectosphaerella cucumerina]|uniref:Secreted protein n=1 Tax=Plectosphaerella cucumerina TaxID=40658 RepID=A0A8K0TEM2_9PEZI|nr:hypothetical protein B0T11DRAFT_81045 [Plectosphaerella cucumerina]
MAGPWLSWYLRLLYHALQVHDSAACRQIEARKDQRPLTPRGTHGLDQDGDRNSCRNQRATNGRPTGIVRVLREVDLATVNPGEADGSR